MATETKKNPTSEDPLKSIDDMEPIKFTVKCGCGKSKATYYSKWKGGYNLIPAELICTNCKSIVKVKDFINGN